jgi:eukaryotic-like serine/threonine-protein kinase
MPTRPKEEQPMSGSPAGGRAPTPPVPDTTDRTVSCSIEVPIDWAAALAAVPGATVAALPGATVATMPSADEIEPKAPAPGRERFRDVGEIGRGGMGTVYRCRDEVLLRDVARKALRGAAPTTRARMQFLEEAQITGQLDHPNIVPVYDLGAQADGQAYFTMKLVSGRTLSELIRDLHRHGFDGDRLEEILRIVLKVCEAVSFAHSRGVVHRDLKPENIMVGSYGQVYVMDWGLGLLLAGRRPSGEPDAATFESPVTTSSPGQSTGLVLAGTVSYMAPEQAAGRLDRIGPWTDVFAFGAILYEILTGRAPYTGPDPGQALARAREARITPPEQASAVPLPPGLCEIAARALRRNPEERFASVDKLREALDQFLRGGGWFATRAYEDGAAIVTEGGPADAAYVLIEGQCAVEQERDGRRVLRRLLSPGDVFGETALVSRKPRTATVRAVGRVTVKVVTAEAFAKELERSELLEALVKQLTARCLDLERRLAETSAADRS